METKNCGITIRWFYVIFINYKKIIAKNVQQSINIYKYMFIYIVNPSSDCAPTLFFTPQLSLRNNRELNAGFSLNLFTRGMTS